MTLKKGFSSVSNETPIVPRAAELPDDDVTPPDVVPAGFVEPPGLGFDCPPPQPRNRANTSGIPSRNRGRIEVSSMNHRRVHTPAHGATAYSTHTIKDRRRFGSR